MGVPSILYYHAPRSWGAVRTRAWTAGYRATLHKATLHKASRASGLWWSRARVRNVYMDQSPRSAARLLALA